METCVHTKADIEALERLMEPENEEVSLRYILKYSTRGGSNIFQLLTQQRKRAILWQVENDGWRVREGRQHSKKVGKMSGNEWQVIQCQGVMARDPPCPERTLKTPLPQQSSPSSRDQESQCVVVEDRRRRRFAVEETAGCMQRYPEDGRHLKVSVTDLQEDVGMSEEAGISIKQVAQQASNENGQTFFEIFRQGKEDVCIASLARWNAQLEGLVELERRCRDTMQEVKLLSERQKILNGMVEDQIRFRAEQRESTTSIF